MRKYPIRAAADTPDVGRLTLQVTSTIGLIPIDGAKISIQNSNDVDTTIEELTTNSSGQTDTIELPAPPFEYSQEPGSNRPYTDYNITITAPGYEPTVISGTEILPDVTAIQNVELTPVETGTSESDIVIPDHTLYGDYPPKIPEDEIKEMDESGSIVLSRVVIPEYIVVHDGTPNNSSAPNYYVTYTDYIKNVVSSEIYATWPESAIYANTLVILSFTLNRVYTEW